MAKATNHICPLYRVGSMKTFKVVLCACRFLYTFPYLRDSRERNFLPACFDQLRMTAGNTHQYQNNLFNLMNPNLNLHFGTYMIEFSLLNQRYCIFLNYMMTVTISDDTLGSILKIDRE